MPSRPIEPVTQFFRDRQHRIAGSQGACAHQDGDALALVEHLGGTLQIVRLRQDARLLITDAGMHRAVLACRRGISLLLQIVGQQQRGHAALTQRGTHRTVHQMPHLGGHAGLLHKRTGHVLEQGGQVDFLLIVAAQRGTCLLPRNCQHRHVIQARIVQTGQQVRGARPRGGDAHTQFAGELGMCGGHEGGHFLMAGLDKFDLAVRAAQCAEHAVDTVAGVPVDAGHAPLVQSFDQKIRYGSVHCLVSADMSEG